MVFAGVGSVAGHVVGDPGVGVVVVGVVLMVIAGAVAGAVARRVVTALPRGMSVRAGPFEVLTAGAWGLVAHLWASAELPGWWVPTVCALIWVAVPLVAVDLRHRRLPDALTMGAMPLLAFALTVASVGGGGWQVAAGAAVGAVGFFGLHALLALLRPGSLGGGDVKLAAPVGAVLGALGVEAVLVALVGASLVTLLLIAAVPRWRRGAPHGPGMLGSACVLAVIAV